MKCTANLGSLLFWRRFAPTAKSLRRPGPLDRRGEEKGVMNSAASAQQAASWVVKDGLRELELLFKAVLSHPSEPILIADDDRHCLDASSAAGKLLGVSKDKIIGHRLDDFL